jgi:NAD+ diphosphatase
MEKLILRCDNRLLLTAAHQLPTAADPMPAPVGEVYHFERESTVYRAQNVADATKFETVDLKAAYTLLPSADYEAAGKAFELLYWDETHRYCPRCGQTLRRATEISKRCPACALELFPQVSPAIIVLIRRGEKALLVHARNFRHPVFGLVAGFVETGESLEECVVREVREETSLTIGNLRYVGSQPWPFPNSLMLGFTADYVAGELRFADGELTEGGFFDKDHLPPLPHKPSIARRMIEEWMSCTFHCINSPF